MMKVVMLICLAGAPDDCRVVTYSLEGDVTQEACAAVILTTRKMLEGAYTVPRASCLREDMA